MEPSGFVINNTYKTNSGITLVQNGAPSSNFVSNTCIGMTTGTTFNNVSPVSTSGSGTGALFTVITNASTNFTSITVTTAGSGYNYGETVTFNATQFGGSSGSITTASALTTNFLSNFTGSTINGVVNTVSSPSGGTGYIAGTKATTGGTGSGLIVIITVGDTITILTGSGTSTFTISTVDFAGTISGFSDISSWTDSKSIYNYWSSYNTPSYNITSTQVGTIGGFLWNPTLTASGNFNIYGFVSAPAASKSGFGLNIPLHTVDVAGSFGTNITSVSTNTTLDATYHTVTVDASGGNITITLPTAGATNIRRIYIVLKSDSSTNTVTISTTAGGNKVINTQYSGFQVQSNGTNWYVIGSF